MKTTVNLLKMFHADAKIIKDYDWLEANLGQLVPMEIVVRVPEVGPVPVERRRCERCRTSWPLPKRPPRARPRFETILRRSPVPDAVPGADGDWPPACSSVIEEEFGPEGRDVVGRAISAATFVRPLPEAGGSTLGQLDPHQRPAAAWKPTATSSCTATICGSTKTTRPSCGGSACASRDQNGRAGRRLRRVRQQPAGDGRAGPRRPAPARRRSCGRLRRQPLAQAGRRRSEPLAGSRRAAGRRARGGADAAKIRRLRDAKLSNRRSRPACPSINTGFSRQHAARPARSTSRLQARSAHRGGSSALPADLQSAARGSRLRRRRRRLARARSGPTCGSRRPLVIDARDHAFAPGTQQQTAYQSQSERASRPSTRASCRSSIRPSGCCSTA